MRSLKAPRCCSASSARIVTASDRPLVTFERGNQHISLRQRLIVSADGRHGVTTQQIGAILGPEHFFAEAFADDVPTAAFA